MKFHIVENKKIIEPSGYKKDGLEEVTLQELITQMPSIYQRNKVMRPNYSGFISGLKVGDIAYYDQTVSHRKPSKDMLWKLTNETFFHTTKDMQDLESGVINQKIISLNLPLTKMKDYEEIKKIIRVNHITRRIIDYFGSNYDLKSRVPVLARRCVLGGGTTELEQLDYAIFVKLINAFLTELHITEKEFINLNLKEMSY